MKTGRGTQCHGLVPMVVGHRLDSMSSEVFNNLIDSVILRAREPLHAVPWATMVTPKCEQGQTQSHNVPLFRPRQLPALPLPYSDKAEETAAEARCGREAAEPFRQGDKQYLLTP